MFSLKYDTCVLKKSGKYLGRKKQNKKKDKKQKQNEYKWMNKLMQK